MRKHCSLRRAGGLLRLIDGLSAAGALCAAAGLVLLAASIAADVIGRGLLNMPLTGTLERTAYWWMPLIVLMAYGHTEARGEHIKVTILLDALPPRMRGIVEGCFSLLGAGLMAALAWYALAEAGDAMRIRQTTASAPPVPIWPFKYLAVAGVALLGMQMVASAIRQFAGAGRDAAGGLS